MKILLTSSLIISHLDILKAMHSATLKVYNTFVFAAYSFNRNEAVVLRIVTLVLFGCLVPYNDSRLTSGSTTEGTFALPFVVSLSNTGSMRDRVANSM